jgi:acyl-CoA synthetase (AMP-forming)/AMP-acid ligase II
VLSRSVLDGELRTFLLNRLADYKVPRRFEAVNELPRNESGKVLKSELVRARRQGGRSDGELYNTDG